LQTAQRARRAVPQLTAGVGLLVVGAEYSLETGVVEFFDAVPAEGAAR